MISAASGVLIGDLPSIRMKPPCQTTRFSEQWQSSLPAAVTPPASKRHGWPRKVRNCWFFLTRGCPPIRTEDIRLWGIVVISITAPELSLLPVHDSGLEVQATVYAGVLLRVPAILIDTACILCMRTCTVAESGGCFVVFSERRRPGIG